MKRFGKRQKLGNQGLSLVELLCSMAILGMLAMVVSSILVVSANSYRRENADTGAQQEAQLVANQITDLLIDTSAHGVVAQVDFDPAAGTLTITQGDVGYEISYVASEQRLYYSQYQLDASGNRMNVTPKQLMAENLKSFSVDVSSFEETGNIGLDMVYAKGTEEYPAAFTVTARNKEQAPGTAAVAELKVPSEIIQEPNQNFYKIKANIVGGSGTLSYTCEGQTDLVGTRVNPDGTVVIGSRETANMFRVRVTAMVNGPSGVTPVEEFVRVYVRRATSVSVTGMLVSGSSCMAGAKYQLEALVNGNNMAKAVGTDYDDPADLSDPNVARNLYVDPYGVEWSVSSTGSTTAHLSTDPSGKAILTLDGNMEDGEEITVTAKSSHARGTNKSGTPYIPGAEGYWKLKKSDSVFIMGDGWLRQTDKAQAVVNQDKLNEVKPPHGGVHKFEVRFREYPEGTWGSYNGITVDHEGWLTNKYGGDADNSMTINMRPVLTGALDYSKDYEMQIRMSIYDEAGNKVWPTAATPPSEYLISNVVYRVGVIFKGDALGFGNSVLVDEASAPTVRMVRDQGYDMMHFTGVQGIEAEYIRNNLAFLLEKKNAAGTWVPVTNNVEVQNAGGTFRLTFRNSDDFAGQYRVKVRSDNMPNYCLEGTQLVNKGNINYILYNEATGHNIFYFNVMK